MTEEIHILFVGTDGQQVVDSSTSREQIVTVERLDCALELKGERLTWQILNNPSEPRTIFQSILNDRVMRVDKKVLMADRPAFAVVTASGQRAIRLEYYEGHDELNLVFDLRAKELHGKELPVYLESDPHAYDPAKFLAEIFGIPEAVSKPVLDAIHKEVKL